MGKTYDEIRTGANTFASATNILAVVGEMGLKQLNNETALQVLAQTMVPAIALKAFSCELALKALIAKCGNEVNREHRLNILFGKIDDQDKRIISQNVIEKMKVKIPTYNEIQFMKDLQDDAKTFVDWRYFYENSVSVKYDFLDVFFSVLFEYIKN